MRVLVAGGAGFLGSHLVDLLVRLGNEVVVLDSLLTGSLANLDHVPPSQITIVHGLAEDAAHADYDRIYHLASPASPDAYEMYQVPTLMANSAGTKRLLDVAEASRARFLLASTSEVYGDPLVHPQPETYWGNVDPIGPRSMYDEGKRFAEALVVAYRKERTADARIARIFNSYGPRMQLNDGRMPSSFVGAAVRGDVVRVHGDGSQTRSLCYVTDTVAGLYAAMERGRRGEAYNIGRADEMSVLEFAKAVVREAGTEAPIELVPGREQDVRRRCPDTSKSERELDWRAITPLSAGLAATVAWYRRHLSVPADAQPSPLARP